MKAVMKVEKEKKEEYANKLLESKKYSQKLIIKHLGALDFGAKATNNY